MTKSINPQSSTKRVADTANTEFAPFDCRTLTTFPNCPGPYRYNGVLVAHDGPREANAVIVIEEGSVTLTGAYGKAATITADCNGAIDFVDQLAKALDGIAAHSAGANRR